MDLSSAAIETEVELVDEDLKVPFNLCYLETFDDGSTRKRTIPLLNHEKWPKHALDVREGADNTVIMSLTPTQKTVQPTKNASPEIAQVEEVRLTSDEIRRIETDSNWCVKIDTQFFEQYFCDPLVRKIERPWVENDGYFPKRNFNFVMPPEEWKTLFNKYDTKPLLLPGYTDIMRKHLSPFNKACTLKLYSKVEGNNTVKAKARFVCTHPGCTLMHTVHIRDIPIKENHNLLCAVQGTGIFNHTQVPPKSYFYDKISSHVEGIRFFNNHNYLKNLFKQNWPLEHAKLMAALDEQIKTPVTREPVIATKRTPVVSSGKKRKTVFLSKSVRQSLKQKGKRIDASLISSPSTSVVQDPPKKKKEKEKKKKRQAVAESCSLLDPDDTDNWRDEVICLGETNFRVLEPLPKLPRSEDVGQEAEKEEHLDEAIIIKRKAWIEGWSKIEVVKWLNKNKLTRVEGFATDLNGKLLLQMKDLLEKSPNTFHEMIKQEFKFKLVDLLRLKQAFKDLDLFLRGKLERKAIF